MKTTLTQTSAIQSSGCRLDASYHASPGVQALHFLQQWANNTAPRHKSVSRILREKQAEYRVGRRVDLLQDVCKPNGIFIPYRFKRIYVDDPESGVPYLTGGDILQADPLSGTKLLSKKYTNNLERLSLQERMILITCSGTIGNCVYVNSNFRGAVGSPDLIRILADTTKILPGYLYTYLSSPLGRALIEQKTYGAVVPHIEAHHLLDLPVPRLAAETEQHIHELIEQAAQLREEANLNLSEVQRQLTSEIGEIPNISRRANTTFIVNSSTVSRLTAFNNKPSVFQARSIVTSVGKYATLQEVAQRIHHPFRMNMVYVEESRGVPFLNLSDMLAARYRTTNFMSPRTQGFEDYLLKYGMTLISRDGTIGKVCFVGHYLENAATNQHITRITPDPEKIPPGYLYAFMSSPYALLQVDGLIYGSVILGVYEKDLGNILVPILSEQAMNQLGEIVENAFDARYSAILLEDEALKLLLDALN